MAGPIVESFSISHAAILNGTTGADLADIFGVRDGTIEADSDSYNNTGDNAVLSVWNWFNMATLTITSGYIPFDVVSLITGDPITSSTTSGATPDYFSMPLWSLGSLNQPALPVLIRCPAKLSTGGTANLDIVLYKVNFTPIKFDGPSYKNGLVLSYGGQAVMANADEVGNALAIPSIGRIVKRPRKTDGTGF